ncbi:hypothetical protein PR048_013284 [Dryococelus australis]|uniref:PiggyBac transposable element-derived protein domain-containing protein n=1 Tax=Dryococelus australis TaxID=614101 RepID=A0ABQ9HRR2_9NEOP|nr:hypothetical protein PR048_013284 [Dryococelus australis]
MVDHEVAVTGSVREKDIIGSGNVEWMEYEGRQKTFAFTVKSGLQTNIAENISLFEAFSLFVDDDVLDHIVRKTNRNGEQEILYTCGNFVIDETLIPWRGQLMFRQYIPKKAHKYGIKFFKFCSIYSGESENYDKMVGNARTICEESTQGLLNEGRTSFYELTLAFLQHEIYVVGTVRQNKKNVPKDVVLNKFEIGDVIAKEDKNGIMVMKWRSTRDVRLLSTKHAPTIAETTNLNRPSSKRPRNNTSNPLDICDYNKGQSGIDISDQMCSYATTLRKGTCIVNAPEVYKAATKKQAKITLFREEITACLRDLP